MVKRCAALTAFPAVLIYVAMWIGWTQNWLWLNGIDQWLLNAGQSAAVRLPSWSLAWDWLCTLLGPMAFRLIGAGVIVVLVIRRRHRAALFGFVTDHRPWPYAMVVGMGATLTGLLAMAFAHSYPVILLAAACVGLGSAVLHPEATRMARHAAAGQQPQYQQQQEETIHGQHLARNAARSAGAALSVPHGDGLRHPRWVSA